MTFRARISNQTCTLMLLRIQGAEESVRVYTIASTATFQDSIAVINVKRILMSLYYRPDPLNSWLDCHLHLTLIQCGVEFDELFRKISNGPIHISVASICLGAICIATFP